jgi:D-alanyl-D-alanine carboxypeptidase
MCLASVSSRRNVLIAISHITREAQSILDAYVATGVTGVSVAFSSPRHASSSVVSGVADTSAPLAMRSDHLLRIASCTKPWVAVAILTLVQAGKLDLDQPTAAWLPDVPRSDKISARLLLGHRSGLPGFPAMPVISQRIWSLEEIIAFALANSEPCEPDIGWEYSNTGFAALALLIERITGTPYQIYLRAALFEPCGLCDTWTGSREKYPYTRLARGYIGVRTIVEPIWNIAGLPEPSGGAWDATDWFHISGATGAGDIVSTPTDVVRFFRAVLDARVVNAGLVAELYSNIGEASYPRISARGYGLGVVAFSRGGTALYGHLGNIPGYTSMLLFDPKSHAVMMFSQNSGELDRQSDVIPKVNEIAFDIWDLIFGVDTR